MKYTIVRCIDGKFTSEKTDDITGWCQAAGVAINGECSSPHLLAYLRGQPKLEGFAGPLGDGGDDGEEAVRYEDWKSFEIFSS